MSQFSTAILNNASGPSLHLNQATVGADPGMSGNLTTVMQDASKAQLQTSLSTVVNTESMVAIASAKAEKGLRKLLADHIAAGQQIKSEIADLERAQQEFLADFAKENIVNTGNFGPFTQALTALYGSAPVIHYGTGVFNDRTGKVSAEVEVKITGKSSSNITVTEEAPAAFLTRRANLQTLARTLEKADRNTLQVRAALSNVDSLERQARATIANKMIASTGQQGKDLIAAIEASVDLDGIVGQLQA